MRKKIDIWKNKETEKQLPEEKIDSLKESKKKIFINPKKNTVNEIKIEDGLIDKSQDDKVFGIYDPSEYDFNLNMWSTTKAEDVRASLKRLKKLNYQKLLMKFLKIFFYHFLIRQLVCRRMNSQVLN